jgi:hypothetical protein
MMTGMVTDEDTLLHSRFVPVYFEKDIDSGIPVLTDAGRKAIEEELQDDDSNEEPLTPRQS